MSLIERYLFRRLLGAFLVAFPALALTIWLTQALPHLSLISDRGQGIWIFLKFTGLLFPSLVMMIAPIAVQITVAYVFNALNSDSELVSIHASGASRVILLKPVLWLCALVTALVALCTVYLTPLTLAKGREAFAQASANIVGSVLQEGRFRQIAQGVTIFVRSRDANGTLHGLFVYDPRDRKQILTYVARTARLSDTVFGKFLFLENGVIQRQVPETGAVNSIEFASYSFDLSALAGSGKIGELYPQEQPLLDLLAPSPNDPYFRRAPGAFVAEFHNRLSAPLYTFVFGLIPLAFLGRVRTTRSGSTLITAAAWGAALGLRGVGLVVAGVLASRTELVPLVYLIPAVGIAVPLYAILSDRPFRLFRSGRPRSGEATA